jgi:hypothetical protein
MDPNLDIGSSEYTFSTNNPLSYRDGRRKSSLRDIESAGTLGLSIMGPATQFATPPNSKSPNSNTTEKQIHQQQRSASFAHVNYVATPLPAKQSHISI